MADIVPDSDGTGIWREYEIMQELLAASGHEWRNHLARLHMGLDLLCCKSEALLTTRQHETLAEMRATVVMMQQISESYLATAALQSQAFMHPAWHKLEEAILQPVLARHQTPLAISGQRVQLRIDPPESQVWADALLLSVVFDNLLANAIKYGQRGGEIHIEASATAAGMELCVWNTSRAHISSTQTQTWFQRFARGSTPNADGVGYGLYLTRRIIEVHGGAIAADAGGCRVGIRFSLPNPQ